jgi:hypothetical protein
MLDLRFSQWLLGYNAMQSEKSPTILRNTSPPCLGSKSKPSKKQVTCHNLLPASCWFLDCHTLQPWSWSRYVPWNFRLFPDYMMLKSRRLCSSRKNYFKILRPENRLYHWYHLCHPHHQIFYSPSSHVSAHMFQTFLSNIRYLTSCK